MGRGNDLSIGEIDSIVKDEIVSMGFRGVRGTITRGREMGASTFEGMTKRVKKGDSSKVVVEKGLRV